MRIVRSRIEYRFFARRPQPPKERKYSFWQYAAMHPPRLGSYVLTAFRHDPCITPIVTKFELVPEIGNKPAFVLSSTEDEVVIEPDLREVQWHPLVPLPTWED